MEVLGRVLVTVVIAFNIMSLFVWLMFRNKLGENFPAEPPPQRDVSEENEEDSGEKNDRTDRENH